LGTWRSLADGGDARSASGSGVHVADAVIFPRAAGQESFFFAGVIMRKPRGRSRREAMEATTLVRRRADGNAQAGAAVDLRLQTPSAAS